MALTGKRYWIAFIQMAICLYLFLFICLKFDIEPELISPIPLLSVGWLMYVVFEPNNPNAKAKTIKVGNFDSYISPKGLFNFYLAIFIIILILWLKDYLIPALFN